MKYLALLFLMSCSQVTTLNLKDHEYGVQPRKIIWFQVAGLEEEHLALLKFDYLKKPIVTSFERFSCYGKVWDYNLFKIRPSAQESFLAQLTGSSNIKNDCSDYEKEGIWSYLHSKGYNAAIFETPLKKNQSLINQCSKKNGFLNDSVFFSMNRSSKKDTNFFHFEKKDQYTKSNVYYDKSCITGKCFSTISQNIMSTFGRIEKNKSKLLYVVRDFSFLNALKKGSVVEAKNSLREIDLALLQLMGYVNKNPGTLLLVSSSSSISVDFPRKGQQWQAYLKQGRFIKSKDTKLISSIFSYGARSENFCGVYEQKDILSRIFLAPKEYDLKRNFLRIFK